MLAVCARHTNRGAKQFVEDRGIDLSRTSPRAPARVLRRHVPARAQVPVPDKANPADRFGIPHADPRSLKCMARAIIREVCEARGFHVDYLLSTARDARVVACRHEAMARVYLECRRDGLPLSIAEMGRLFKRDHSTVLHGLSKMGVR